MNQHDQTLSNLNAVLADLRGTNDKQDAWIRVATDAINSLTAERDAAQSELAEARRLLALATSFDAGPLLGDVPEGWTYEMPRGMLIKNDSHSLVRISHWPVEPACWVVGITRIGFLALSAEGEWIAGSTDEMLSRCGFPSPAAALAALDAWRGARRAEIAERGESVTQTEDES